MSRYFRMKKPGQAENLKAGLLAGGAAAAVAAVSFYLARVFMSREALEPLDSPELRGPTDTQEKESKGDGI